MKQYLKHWCSPGYPGNPSNDPPVQDRAAAAAAGLVAGTLEQYLNFYIVAEFSQFILSSPRKIYIDFSLQNVRNG